MGVEYYEYDTERDVIKPMKKKDVKKKKLGFLKKVDKWALFKEILSVAAGGCASHMVNRYLHANLPESDSTVERIMTGVGVYFVTGVVADKVSDYTAQELEGFKEKLKAAREELELEDGEEKDV